ncbi:alpha/beta fold hydrolase [Acidobacteria bacterium AB60]|nr:alpha/beta fold hydrolase [Acidobacteria bacterium AB60]
MPLLRSAAILTISTLAVWLSCSAALGVVMVEGALHPGRSRLTASQLDAAQDMAVRDNASFQELSLRAADSADLRAWLLQPAAWNHDTVILLHGQSDNRAGMLFNADLLLRHGYSILLPDARAHGQSDGPIATYGALESDDLHRWFLWLQQNHPPRCIDGIGNSMGAAQLLESVAINHYCAVIAESPFATFREAAYDRVGQQFDTGPWLGRTLLRPAVELGFLYARSRYHIDLAHASPLPAVAASHTPILLIHGLADNNLPPRHSVLLAAADRAAQLWEPPATGHCAAFSTHPVEYEQRVLDWLATHTQH